MVGTTRRRRNMPARGACPAWSEAPSVVHLIALQTQNETCQEGERATERGAEEGGGKGEASASDLPGLCGRVVPEMVPVTMRGMAKHGW